MRHYKRTTQKFSNALAALADYEDEVAQWPAEVHEAVEEEAARIAQAIDDELMDDYVHEQELRDLEHFHRQDGGDDNSDD